jgi:hypothetical protein
MFVIIRLLMCSPVVIDATINVPQNPSIAANNEIYPLTIITTVADYRTNTLYVDNVAALYDYKSKSAVTHHITSSAHSWKDMEIIKRGLNYYIIKGILEMVYSNEMVSDLIRGSKTKKLSRFVIDTLRLLNKSNTNSEGCRVWFNVRIYKENPFSGIKFSAIDLVAEPSSNSSCDYFIYLPTAIDEIGVLMCIVLNTMAIYIYNIPTVFNYKKCENCEASLEHVLVSDRICGTAVIDNKACKICHTAGDGLRRYYDNTVINYGGSDKLEYAIVESNICCPVVDSLMNSIITRYPVLCDSCFPGKLNHVKPLEQIALNAKLTEHIDEIISDAVEPMKILKETDYSPHCGTGYDTCLYNISYIIRAIDNAYPSDLRLNRVIYDDGIRCI